MNITITVKTDTKIYYNVTAPPNYITEGGVVFWNTNTTLRFIPLQRVVYVDAEDVKQ